MSYRNGFLCFHSITVVVEVMPLFFWTLFLIWGTRVRRVSEGRTWEQMLEIETVPSLVLSLSFFLPPSLLSSPLLYIYIK